MPSFSYVAINHLGKRIKNSVDAASLENARNSLRAAGDVKFTLVVSMSSMWLCRVALCYLLCYTFNMGLDGVWYAMYADWMFRIIFFVTRFARGKWKSCKVI